MDRGIECLSRFGQRLRHLKSDSVRVVGTNTLRKARNGWEFISRAEQVIGHPIEIISGREEARLIYKGVCYAMGPAADRRLVIDIGGGSTELILGRGYEPELMDSLYMGCVSMSERFFDDGELKASRFSAAELAARQELEPVEALYRRRGWDTVIGTSGTINAIHDVAAKMIEGSRRSDARRAHRHHEGADRREAHRSAVPQRFAERTHAGVSRRCCDSARRSSRASASSG